MAPPKARGWAEGLVGDRGPSTNRPSSDSAKRNRATGGSVDLKAKRLSVTYEDVEVPEDDEPAVITVARKAFEKYRKAHEKDDENRDDPEPLELEITVTETGELTVEERDKSDEQKRAERLTRDFEFGGEPDDEAPEPEARGDREDHQRADRLTRDFELDPDLTEAVKAFLETMAEDRHWEHATFTITTDLIEATFDDPEEGSRSPIVVDIELPDLPTLDDLDFDPAFNPRPLDVSFSPGIVDPENVFTPKERAIAERLAEEGWRVDARPADHTRDKVRNPDSMVRKARGAAGVVVEFKTPISGKPNAIKRNIHEASNQAGEGNEILIDGRGIDLSEDVASRAFRRACGQPGGQVADVVHVIVGDGRLITYTKEN
ncbi:hypothetical protein [Kribbella sp. NPDC050459]|uniref:hypothetical protein n=1 Tax=Kribbella sp. NPDC050459 TaxID=3155785 RepID=UPI0033E46251